MNKKKVMKFIIAILKNLFSKSNKDSEKNLPGECHECACELEPFSCVWATDYSGHCQPEVVHCSVCAHENGNWVNAIMVNGNRCVPVLIFKPEQIKKIEETQRQPGRVVSIKKSA